MSTIDPIDAPGLKAKKILLTGATGFLGSHLLKTFLEAGCQIAILKRSFSDIRRIRQYLSMVKCFDIDLVPIESPFEECGPFDCVVHTATNYGRRGDAAIEVFDANLSFPLRLLNIATLFNTAAFFNTGTFFNKATSLYSYLNYYTLSKQQFEDWGRVFASQGKIQFVNIKIEHMYGPGDDLSKFTTWIVQSFIKNIEKLDLTPGEQRRDFIFIDDVVSTYEFLVGIAGKSEGGFQEFELGSGKAVSIREFVETAKRLTGADTFLAFGAKELHAHELMHSEADLANLSKLGWKSKYDLNTGLKKMIEGEKKLGVDVQI